MASQPIRTQENYPIRAQKTSQAEASCKTQKDKTQSSMLKFDILEK
jgi:hypothetical protein